MGQSRNIKPKWTLVAYSLSLALWAAWCPVGNKLSLPGLAVPFAVDGAVRAVVWLGPAVWFFLRKDEEWLLTPRTLFSLPFPWFPTLVGLCLTTAFLHTMHILMSGIATWGVFQPIWIGMALAAAIIEEFTFRGFLFNRQAHAYGTVKAAIFNGILFAIYHYPEFLIGQNLQAILSLRFWLIVVMGFIFSTAFAKWKNLGMVIAIHFIWNMLCFWFALA